MSHSEKPLMMVLPVGWQSIYFIVIAFACYMGLDALGVSLSYLVSYPVTTERLLLSYGGLVLLAICIFFKSPHRFYKHHLCTRQKCSKSQRSWTRRQITY